MVNNEKLFLDKDIDKLEDFINTLNQDISDRLIIKYLILANHLRLRISDFKPVTDQEYTDKVRLVRDLINYIDVLRMVKAKRGI